MMIVLQLVLYCLLYFLLVKAAAGNDGLRCLYFYPKEYQEEAFRRGLAEKETVARQSKRFMIPFCLVMLAALAAILTFWNRAADFKTALWQSALFLVVMNWFDGIVIDRLWVGRSPVWRIRGMEGIPYVKPWKTVLTRRALGTVVYLILAPAVAGLALLLGRLCAAGGPAQRSARVLCWFQKENCFLGCERNESHGQGRLPPVFQKTKGVSDMDRVKKNFGFGCITTASSIPCPAAERPTASNAANAKRSVPSICPSASCSRMWQRNLKKPDIFRRENDPENRPAALRSAADPVLLGRRPRCPGTAHRAQISEDCRRSQRRCC